MRVIWYINAGSIGSCPYSLTTEFHLLFMRSGWHCDWEIMKESPYTPENYVETFL